MFKNRFSVPAMLLALFIAGPGITASYGRALFHVEPDDGKAWLLTEIDGSAKYIDLTIYEMSDRDILAALCRAHARGVYVRVLINHFRDRRHDKVTAVETNVLAGAGIACKFASPGFPFTHEKCILIDGNEAVIMSLNLNPDYFKTTRDFAVVTTNSDDLKEIGRVFDSDWNFKKAYILEDKSLIWSPETARDMLTALLRSAKRNVDIYNEELRDRDIIRVLTLIAGKGIKVRVICPVLKEGGRDGNLDGAQSLSGAGAMVREIKESKNKLYIHAKAIVVDNSEAYVGSINFSKFSMDRNRELGIIISDAGYIKRIEDAFGKDWNE